MKRPGLLGGIVVASGLAQTRSTPCSSPVEKWCRRLSSLRGSAERSKSRKESILPVNVKSGNLMAQSWQWSYTRHICRLFAADYEKSQQRNLKHANFTTMEGYSGWSNAPLKQLAKRGKLLKVQSRVSHNSNDGLGGREQFLRTVDCEGQLNRESWRRLCDEGKLEEAFRLLALVDPQQDSGFRDMVYCILKECIARKNLAVGKLTHGLVVRRGQERDTFLGNHLIRLYASRGNLLEAKNVFSKLLIPTVYVWTSIISAHSELGEPEQALKLYQQMRKLPVNRDNYVYVAVLKACARAVDLMFGRLVHGDVLDSGFESDLYIGNTLVDMYSKCGSLDDARRVFDGLQSKDVVTWSAMISGYARHSDGHEALKLYAAMQQEGVVPDNLTYASVLKACCSEGAIEVGKQIHAQVLDEGREADVFLANTLVDMYAKCGNLEDARRVFDKLSMKNVVTWNAMIAGYARHGLGQEALTLFACMQQEGRVADRITFVNMLKACGSIPALHEGKKLHSQIRERGLEMDLFVANTLIDMYVRCGSLQDGRRLFDRLSSRNVVTWNAMLAGYVQHGFYQESMELYERMQQDGLKPDKVTLTSILRACSSLGATQPGTQIHAQILEWKLEADPSIANSLVDMYVRCGSLGDACGVFERMPVKDMVTWNLIIVGCTQRGLVHEALEVYARMQRDGMAPDSVTIASALKACGILKATDKGKEIHSQIVERGLESDVFVGNALVDFYAKCGELKDARKVFDRLTTKDVVTWNAMVAGYAQHGFGQEAYELFENMQQVGVAPDNFTYVSILKACGILGAIQEGRRIHAQILECGLETDKFVGSALLYMYAKCGSLQEAQRLFDRLSRKDVVAWTALIDAYGQHNDGRMAIKCYGEMRRQGVEPDAATFTSLLAACSHAGLVNEGEKYFREMSEEHGMTPNLQHYNCMVDLLGRSGRLNEAESLLQTMPFEQQMVGWMSLLNACKMYGNRELARHCFDQLVQMEPKHGSAYVLMSKIYREAGRLEDADAIDSLRKCADAPKKPASALIEVNHKVHEFTVGQMRDDISLKLRSLNLHMKEEGHDKEEEEGLCGHAEKLAVGYGLLNTPQGTTLVIMKNLRMCNHCHRGTKIISRIENREIVVRDAHHVHHFKDGICSCGDNH